LRQLRAELNVCVVRPSTFRRLTLPPPPPSPPLPSSAVVTGGWPSPPPPLPPPKVKSLARTTTTTRRKKSSWTDRYTRGSLKKAQIDSYFKVENVSSDRRRQGQTNEAAWGGNSSLFSLCSTPSRTSFAGRHPRLFLPRRSQMLGKGDIDKRKGRWQPPSRLHRRRCSWGVNGDGWGGQAVSDSTIAFREQWERSVSFAVRFESFVKLLLPWLATRRPLCYSSLKGGAVFVHVRAEASWEALFPPTTYRKSMRSPTFYGEGVKKEICEPCVQDVSTKGGSSQEGGKPSGGVNESRATKPLPL